MRFCLRPLEWKVEKIGENEDVGGTIKNSPCDHSYFVGRICCWKVESSLCFSGWLWCGCMFGVFMVSSNCLVSFDPLPQCYLYPCSFVVLQASDFVLGQNQHFPEQRS